MTASHDHRSRALVATGFIAFGRRAPGADGHAGLTSAALATTMGVIDRVHCHTPDRRTDTAPTNGACLTELTQVVLFVTDLTNRRTALNVDPTNLA